MIGEPSGGGSCCVQISIDPEGLYYSISTAQWKLRDSSGVSVESGCRIDVPIDTPTKPITEFPEDPIVDTIAYLAGKDTVVPVYQDYYDDSLLDEIMNDWFGTEGQLDEAA